LNKDTRKLTVKSCQHGTATVIEPSGRIDSTTAKEFEQLIAPPLVAGSHRLVVDLSGLEYISSAGLRVFLTAAKQCKSAGGALTLCSASDGVREVFEISGFSSLFGLHDSVEAAVKLFGEATA